MVRGEEPRKGTSFLPLSGRSQRNDEEQCGVRKGGGPFVRVRHRSITLRLGVCVAWGFRTVLRGGFFSVAYVAVPGNAEEDLSITMLWRVANAEIPCAVQPG